MPSTKLLPRENYLKEITAQGIHNEVFEFFSKHIPTTSSILDCGAGEGAWAERLIQNGYSNVKAIEINQSRYSAQADVYTIDLNHDFSEHVLERFDVITTIEVIEHLDNPINFLKQCSKLMKPEGILLVTTPNTECLPGRLKFLLQGRLRHFDESGDATHITPILSGILPKLAIKSGLKVAEIYPLVRYWEDERNLVKVISRILAPFLKGHVYGECHLFVLRRNGL